MALTEAQLVAQGKEAYASHCAACHQANGLGIAGVFPPIAAERPFAASEPMLKPLSDRGFYKDGKIVQGSVQQHIDIVIHGIAGTAMAGFGSQLDDASVAAIVTFERNAFGNHTGDVVQAADVAAVRGKP